MNKEISLRKGRVGANYDGQTVIDLVDMQEVIWDLGGDVQRNLKFQKLFSQDESIS